MDAEWNRLRTKKVWDIGSVQEWGKVAARARADGREVAFGYVFGICVLKNAELPEGHASRKYKGRVVFQGNRVVNQNWEAAMFQDLGSAPATLEAGRAADCLGCAPGCTISIADAEQAYVQAELRGTETWVALPEEAWPEEWHKQKFHKPVVRLTKALYGHPDSGTFWERHCDQGVRKAGFEPVGPSWPSCYRNAELGLFLTIYVDDFKMAGPKKAHAEGWKRLRKSLSIEPEKYLDDGPALYLGCTLKKSERTLADGKTATFLDYIMGDFLKSSVKLYLELAGAGTKLRPVDTPFVVEDQQKSQQGAPASTGSIIECPWCCHTFPPKVHENLKELEKTKKASGTPKRSKSTTKDLSQDSGDVTTVKPEGGRLQPIAAKILMKVLYGARAARLDLLRAIGHLACFITRWTSECDRKLHRLMCYVDSSLRLQMGGWVGDPIDSVQPHLFADADFAGCTDTQRSTSGYYLVIRGARTCFPISGVSKRQGCVSHSTPEAEMVAADFALRHCGLPALDLWQSVLPSCEVLVVHEDNQAMIRIIETGKNPTMRYLHRTHRVSVAWLHEVFSGDHLTMVYEVSAKMCADIFTKGFTDKTSWDAVCRLINHIDADKLDQILKVITSEADQSASPEGGGPERAQKAKAKAKGKAKAKAKAKAAVSAGPPTSGDIAAGGPRSYYDSLPLSKSGEGSGDVTAALPTEAKEGDVFYLTQKEHDRIVHEMNKITWPRQLRRSVNKLGKGEALGTCLGATNDPNGARLGQHTGEMEHLVKFINKSLRRKFKKTKGFRWSSLQINKNTVSAPHRDSNNDGLSAIILLGDFTGGSFGVDGSDLKLSEPRKGMMIDGSKTHQSQPFQGTRYSIVAFYHKGAEDLDKGDREYLTKLGFHLDSTAAPARNLVQTCCDDDNVLNQATSKNKDCKMVNVTEFDDFTSRVGIDKAKAGLVGPCDALWNSAPCTGGSVLQSLNIHLYLSLIHI